MFSAFKELKNAQDLRESRALENHAMMVMMVALRKKVPNVPNSGRARSLLV